MERGRGDKVNCKGKVNNCVARSRTRSYLKKKKKKDFVNPFFIYKVSKHKILIFFISCYKSSDYFEQIFFRLVQ